MATLVQGEYIPSKNLQLIASFTAYAAQLTGASGLVLGVNHTGTSSLGTFTPTPNQAPIMAPMAITITNTLVTAWGAAPTAGTLNFTINGVSSGAQSFSNINLTTVLNISAGTGIGLAANTRYPFTVTASGWTQAVTGGIEVLIYGYLT